MTRAQRLILATIILAALLAFSIWYVTRQH